MTDVRPAVMEDAPALVPLFDELGYPGDVGKAQRALRRVAEDPLARAWVAVRDQRVVGLVAARAGWFFQRDDDYVEVLAMVTERRAQRRGVGSALLGAVEAWAAQRQVGAVVLGSAHGRAGAHSFYERHGYDAVGLRFRKELRR